jgi:hypothetical protein
MHRPSSVSPQTANCLTPVGDLAVGPDGRLYLLSDKSSTIARLDDLPAGGGAAALLDAWLLGELDGKPEGLGFTPQGQAIVGLDTRKARRNLVLLEPAVAQRDVRVRRSARNHRERERLRPSPS